MRDEADVPRAHRQSLAVARPEPYEVQANHDKQEGLQPQCALQRMALVGRQCIDQAGRCDHTEEKYAFVDEAGQATAQTRCQAERRRGRHGSMGGAEAAAAVRTAAPWAPRLGSSVDGLTKPSVAAILGMPTCW